MDTSYYPLIRRSAVGQFVAWIPDLPGIAAADPNESEVLRELSRGAQLSSQDRYWHKLAGGRRRP